MGVTVVHSIADVRRAVFDARRRGVTVGVVPTMGALHRGHASLIERARAECGMVVVTIFVNPLQFDRAEDLARYPRTLDADVAVCERAGADIVFAPVAAEMYPREPRCTIEVARLGDHLCGAFRPGHFGGVATVVMKLLQIAGADRAYFGEKDAQQLAIVRRLVDDFNVPVTIVNVETVRDPDGLAISSRNQHLAPAERQLAPALYAALAAARAAVERGEGDPGAVRAEAVSHIGPDDRLRLEYLEIVDPDTMEPVPHIASPVIAAGALWVGATRLIDNVRCTPPS